MIKNILLAFAVISVLVLGYLVLVDEPKVVDQPKTYNGEYLQVLSDPYTQTEVEEGLDRFGEVFGGMRPSNFKTTLARSLSATASTSETIHTTSLTTKDSHALDSDDIGDFVCFHINPGASNDEISCCTGITSNNFTGCTRGYNFYSTGTTSGNAKAHSPGETIVISNDDHYLTTQYAPVDSMATISGNWLFFSDDSIASIAFGDRNTNTYDKRIYIANGDSNEPYIGYDESANAWVIANDGSTTIAIGGTTATFTGGDGIDITTSVISVDIASSSGLSIFSDTSLGIKASTSFNSLSIDDQGYIYVATSSMTFSDTFFLTHASISDDFEVSEGATASISTLTLDTALDETYGGTGTASWDKYDICYISADNTFGAISSGSEGQQFTMLNNGVPGWGSSFGSVASSFSVSNITATGTYDAPGLANYEVAYVIMNCTDAANDSATLTYGFIWRLIGPTSIKQLYNQTVDHELTVAWDDTNDEIDYTEGGTLTWSITVYLFK